MPYFDLNTFQTLPVKGYDFTIIGAGAVGILLAVKLSEKGLKVNIIESGHFNEDENRQCLNKVLHKGKFLNTAVWGRKRAIGGTTIAWGGQSLPFSKIDFEERDWMENSGWAINFDDLASFYDEANQFMGIDNWGYYDSMLKKLDLLNIKPKTDEFIYHVSKWANTPNFSTIYRKTLKEKIDIYYNSHLTKISKTDNKITTIDVENFKKNKFNLPIQNLIIAAGGIETVRILQLSSLSTSDTLGLGFMEHPCIEFGKIKNFKPYHLQRLFNTHYLKGKKYSLRLSLSEKQQREKKILNASVSLLFEYSKESLNPYAEIKTFIKKASLKKLPSVLKSTTFMLSTLSSYLFRGFLYKPKSIPTLNMMLEQEATAKSKIYLSKELDQFGQQKAEIDWQISELTWRTFLETCSCTKKVFKENNLGEVLIYPNLNRSTINYNDHFSGVNHHMGGAKLGNTSRNSTVDTDLKLWDYQNAFVCSSAVFPTSSHSNPTLTLLALACRLANFLNSSRKKS